MAVGDIFALFKNQTDGLLRDIKKGIKEEGTKKVKETAFQQLPTSEKITNDFTNLSKDKHLLQISLIYSYIPDNSTDSVQLNFNNNNNTIKRI